MKARKFKMKNKKRCYIFVKCCSCCNWNKCCKFISLTDFIKETNYFGEIASYIINSFTAPLLDIKNDIAYYVMSILIYFVVLFNIIMRIYKFSKR